MTKNTCVCCWETIVDQVYYEPDSGTYCEDCWKIIDEKETEE